MGRQGTRRRRVVLGAVGVVCGAAAGAAVVGSVVEHRVISVTRSTDASVDALWALWAVPTDPSRWDQAVESATYDGPFATGQTGTVTLKGQPSRRFEVVECRPKTAYTDRFFLPAGGKMDWRHTIVDGGSERVVTFEVIVHGPTALLLRPIMASILDRELPSTVDTFVEVAEADTRGSSG